MAGAGGLLQRSSAKWAALESCGICARQFCGHAQPPFFVQTSKLALPALTLAAVGVAYGDIGTSVLYAMKEVFGSGHVPFTQNNVYGILSIFFWTLSLIVSLKYVVRSTCRVPCRHVVS